MVTTIQTSKEQEKMLLGAWLTGHNVDDMKLFKATDFTDPELFRNIGKGTIWEIKNRLNRPYKELADICDFYKDGFYETFYQTALDGFFLEKVKSRIINDCETIGTLDEVASIIKKHIRESCPKIANKNYLESFQKEIEERRTGKTAKFGLSTLDEILGGLFRTEMTVISAKTSVGKSAFALQVAENVSQTNKVIFFPLEMSTNAMIGRMLMRQGLITSKQLKSGNIEGNEEKIEQYIKKLQETNNLLFYEGINKLEDIKAIVSNEKPYLVVIDQLSQIAVPQRFANINEKYSYISREIKSICMEENVATLLLCQVSPKNIQPDPLASIKDSSQIPADADNVIILNRLELNRDRKALKNGEELPIKLYDGESLIKLDFPKQRMGTIGCYYLAFNREKQTFIERMTSRVIEI